MSKWPFEPLLFSEKAPQELRASAAHEEQAFYAHRALAEWLRAQHTQSRSK